MSSSNNNEPASQEQFIRDHTEPAEYGEDGNYYVLHGGYNHGAAIRKFQEFVHGIYEDGDIPIVTTVNVRRCMLGWDEEAGYALLVGDTDKMPRYEGWMLWLK